MKEIIGELTAVTPNSQLASDRYMRTDALGMTILTRDSQVSFSATAANWDENSSADAQFRQYIDGDVRATLMDCANLDGCAFGRWKRRGTIAEWITPANLLPGRITPDVITADFNRDGKVDAFVYNTTLGGAKLFLGNGNGTLRTPLDVTVPFASDSFRPAFHYTTGFDVNSVMLMDLNRDGHRDLVASSGRAGQLAVFLNAGQGNFSNPTTYPIPGAYFATTGDIQRGRTSGPGGRRRDY